MYLEMFYLYLARGRQHSKGAGACEVSSSEQCDLASSENSKLPPFRYTRLRRSRFREVAQEAHAFIAFTAVVAVPKCTCERDARPEAGWLAEQVEVREPRLFPKGRFRLHWIVISPESQDNSPNQLLAQKYKAALL